MRIINANKSIILEGKQAGMKLDGDVAVDEKLSSSQGRKCCMSSIATSFS